MDEDWELSKREFELRVQSIMKRYIKHIIEELGLASEDTTPSTELHFERGYLGIYYGIDSEAERPLTKEIRELMLGAIEEIEELWDAQFPDIEFEIEEDFKEVNLCLHLNGQPLPQEPPADLRDIDITVDKLRFHERKRIHEAHAEMYVHATNHREWISRILEERARRGERTDFPWLTLPE